MHSMQQQTNVLRTWQKQCNKNIAKLQEEAKRVIGLIQPVHQNVRDVAASVERNKMEYVSSNLVEHMQKVEEHVHA